MERICLAGTIEENYTSPRTVKAIGNGHCDRVEECLRLLEKLNIFAISTSPSPKRISHTAARNTSIRTGTPRSIHETGTAIKKNIFDYLGDQISTSMINLKIGKEEELLEETDIPASRNIMDNEIPPSMNIGNESGYECSKEIGKAEMKERKSMGEEKPAVQEEMAEKKDSPVEGKQLPASSNIKEHEIEDDSWEIEAMRTQEIYEEQIRSEDKKEKPNRHRKSNLQEQSGRTGTSTHRE